MPGVVNDPIADMLTRIRNGINARHMKVPMPSSKLKVRVAEVLKKEGFIESYEVQNGQSVPMLTIELRYDRNRDPVITGLKRISRPGLRQYVGVDKIPSVRNGLGVAILSTSRGVVTDREARRQRIGGELMCTVW
ncbi:MAG TPA: 30S ribosomal protein S8 [Myxococcales bacterium LLY-WYZ-16_1]|jgi:small subunit ribosomal protein S8|nr:30S ribosomal protein S8 [Myxococcales bacterium LLY-WYZ-16_1]